MSEPLDRQGLTRRRTELITQLSQIKRRIVEEKAAGRARVDKISAQLAIEKAGTRSLVMSLEAERVRLGTELVEIHDALGSARAESIRQDKIAAVTRGAGTIWDSIPNKSHVDAVRAFRQDPAVSEARAAWRAAFAAATTAEERAAADDALEDALEALYARHGTDQTRCQWVDEYLASLGLPSTAAKPEPEPTPAEPEPEPAPAPNAVLLSRVQAFNANLDVVAARARYNAAHALEYGPAAMAEEKARLDAVLLKVAPLHGLTLADLQAFEPAAVERQPLVRVSVPTVMPAPAAPPAPVELKPGEKHPTLTAPKPRYRSPVMRPTRDLEGEDGIGE